MEDDGVGRARGLLAAQREQLLPAWIDATASRLRGRMSRQELDADLGAIYSALAGGDDDLDEVRAVTRRLTVVNAGHLPHWS
jgi:hypothetical protein